MLFERSLDGAGLKMKALLQHGEPGAQAPPVVHAVIAPGFDAVGMARHLVAEDQKTAVRRGARERYGGKLGDHGTYRVYGLAFERGNTVPRTEERSVGKECVRT